MVKLVEHCWRAFFGAEAARVRATLDANSKWRGPWAGVNEMCSLAHVLLKLLIKRNRRCADTLQSVDAVELLLEQLPSGWNPPVIEVFDALMRSDVQASEAKGGGAKGGGGYQLYKSDIKALVDQIHEQLSRKVTAPSPPNPNPDTDPNPNPDPDPDLDTATDPNPDANPDPNPSPDRTPTPTPTPDPHPHPPPTPNPHAEGGRAGRGRARRLQL